MDSLVFTVSAIFVGANLAFAAVIHLEKILDSFSSRLKPFLLLLVLSAASLSILSSHWFFGNEVIAYCSLSLLLCAYTIISFFCILSITILPRHFRIIDEVDEILNTHRT